MKIILERMPLTVTRSTKTLTNIAWFTRAAASRAPLIFAVDDLPWLTDLYAFVLEATGCVVRTFNDRADVLAALQAASGKPDLLITDYLNASMPFDWFMHDCRAVHPALPILMVSGFDQTIARPFAGRPDRFLRKPFTSQELRRQVTAALERDDPQPVWRALESCGAC